MQTTQNFFSVGFELILRDLPIPYDLYINSSALAQREKFVRIFPLGGLLSNEDLKEFKKKYHQLYVHESQRDSYLRSLAKNDLLDDVEKTKVIKDSAIHYLNGLFSPDKEYTTEILAESIDGCRESVESMIDVLEGYDISKVQKLIADLSFHDFYTYDHSINVSMYCISLYKAWKPKAPRNEIVMAGLGGLLHDLGKIKIPTAIINNPGKLSDEDFLVIKKHPGYGNSLIQESHCACEGVDFEVIRRIVYEHHENFNGTGYPQGLEGVDIHELARVTAIADFFDAITTKRSYHEALKVEDALAVMARSVGKKIDPELFEIFSENVNKLKFLGKTNRELPVDFDPCQPHDVLPFQAVKAEVKRNDLFAKEQADFGKVKTQDKSKKKNKKKAA